MFLSFFPSYLLQKGWFTIYWASFSFGLRGIAPASLPVRLCIYKHLFSQITYTLRVIYDYLGCVVKLLYFTNTQSARFIFTAERSPNCRSCHLSEFIAGFTET
jgi:hypothetical protein